MGLLPWMMKEKDSNGCLRNGDVRKNLCEEVLNQEVRANHCPASGSAQLTSDILTWWWARISGFGDFLEQFDPWTVDSWRVRNDG